MSHVPVLLALRQLADVARPARGRRARLHVLFAVIPAAAVDWSARGLASVLRRSAGPTRCGPVIVEAFITEQEAARALADPRLAHLAAAELNAVATGFTAAPAGSVLLIARCRVLWPQVRDQVERS